MAWFLFILKVINSILDEEKTSENFNNIDAFGVSACWQFVLFYVYIKHHFCVCAWTVKNDVEDETLKDEMAQEYKALQSQQMQLPYQPALTDAQLRKKSNSRSFKKFFVKLVSAVFFSTMWDPRLWDPRL